MTKKAKRRKQPDRQRPKPKPPKLMTAKEYVAALDELELTAASQRTAMLLGLSLRQCQRLASGEQPVPRPVQRLLQMLLKFGTDEDKVTVRCHDSTLVEAIRIDHSAGIWDVLYPWGVDRLYGDTKEITQRIRDKVREHEEADG